jgi:microcin C transport system ATP-binding protein
MAVLMITHDLNLVRRFADRVAVMEDGDIVEQGSVAEVFARPQTCLYPASHRQPPGARPWSMLPAQPAARAAGRQPRFAGEPPAVSYPTRLPGMQGWFRKGRFVAVKDASLALVAGPDAGCHR